MSQRFGGTIAHGWSPDRTDSRANEFERPRSRSHRADVVLYWVCSMVGRLAIDPVEDRNLLFDQYDFKLRSQGDRLGVFCLSIAPALLGMGIVLIAFKMIRMLVPGPKSDSE